MKKVQKNAALVMAQAENPNPASHRGAAEEKHKVAFGEKAEDTRTRRRDAATQTPGKRLFMEDLEASVAEEDSAAGPQAGVVRKAVIGPPKSSADRAADHINIAVPLSSDKTHDEDVTTRAADMRGAPPSARTRTISHKTRHSLLRRVYIIHLAQTGVVTGLVHLFVLFRPVARFAISHPYGWIAFALAMLALYALMMCGPIRWRRKAPTNVMLLISYTLVIGGGLGYVTAVMINLYDDSKRTVAILYDPVFAFYLLMSLTIFLASWQTSYKFVNTRPIGFLFCVTGTCYKLVLMVAWVAVYRVVDPPPPSPMCAIMLVIFEIATAAYWYTLLLLTQYMLEGRFDVAIDPKNAVAALMYIQESAQYMVAYYFYSWVFNCVYCMATIVKRKTNPRANYVYRKYWTAEGSKFYGDVEEDLDSNE